MSNTRIEEKVNVFLRCCSQQWLNRMFRIHKLNTIIQICHIYEVLNLFISFPETDVKSDTETRCKGTQRGSEIGGDDEKEESRLACSEGGRGMLSNERCCSQNNQVLHFAACSYLMYSASCGSCCNKTIWASHWRALVANVFHRPKDCLRGWRNGHVSCAAHLVRGDVGWRRKLLCTLD